MFGPWTARSQGPPRSACSSDRGIHTEAAERLHQQQAKAPGEQATAEKRMSFTRSKTSPADFGLASGKNGCPHEGRHDPMAQRDRMTMFKRQLAANRTRGTEEVVKRNRANYLNSISQQHKTVAASAEQASKDSFVTRSVVEALREERGGGGGGGGGRGGGEGEGVVVPGLGGAGDQRTSLPIASKDWPFVYFVVALDQMPVALDDMADMKVGKPNTARERQRFLAARKRRIQQSREEMERIRESNIDMGLRLEPIRPATRTASHPRTPLPPDHPRQRLNTNKPPPTPNSSESSRDFPMHRGGEHFLNNGDQLNMEEMVSRGFSQWFSDNFSTASNSLAGIRPGGEVTTEGPGGSKEKADFQTPVQNVSGSSSVHFPDIVAEQGKGKGRNKGKDFNTNPPNSAPGSLHAGSSNNKKVHFAEGLPFIKGSGLQLPQTKQDVDPSSGPLTTPYVSKDENEGEDGNVEDFDDMLKPPWTAPVMSRSLPTMTPKSKNVQPLAMPKIYIVSEIYDELIVKTTQSFQAREGYSEAKFSNLRKKIMARLSATYPHLASHRAWRSAGNIQTDATNAKVAPGPIHPENDERSRLRLRPLHQGFFGSDTRLDVSGEGSFLGRLQFPPHSSRQATSDFLRPRWVVFDFFFPSWPVTPTNRTSSFLRGPEEEDAYPDSAFMAIDGRHIIFTSREDLPLKTATLPGATSDFRMGPLTLNDDPKPAQTWTHVIPGAVDE
ncbi:hypothetical protein ACOMHN_027021 [Nucella lapillus]